MKNYQTYRFNDIRRKINELICSGLSEQEALAIVIQNR